ncbi:4-hydroxybenzoyl-CoA thioesterase [Arthrobacter livingstonensis]|uniref:4-hydroxybenzoyl-CoA thioesterase n=2 Tax=Arthrobacter livingstonensis TaxID=670078 RepID=A0A2V5L7Q6_9MICC|nr:4-hydroxybenzoyl-CoA thioesterase [Arthrobacter livingstonensis]
MSEAFYVLAFGFATTAVMDQLGMDGAYREATAASLYTVEAHVRYLGEVGPGEELSITSAIASSGARKLHLAHEMHRGGQLVATEEILGLHVNQDSGTTPFPAAVLGAIGSHDSRVPEWSGRSISA